MSGARRPRNVLRLGPAAGCGTWRRRALREGHKQPGGSGQYVALGSSFAAGPGIAPADDDSLALCIRSAHNYAHLLAKARGLDLTDVTCSGATALHVLEGGQYFQAAQSRCQQ